MADNNNKKKFTPLIGKHYVNQYNFGAPYAKIGFSFVDLVTLFMQLNMKSKYVNLFPKWNIVMKNGLLDEKESYFLTNMANNYDKDAYKLAKTLHNNDQLQNDLLNAIDTVIAEHLDTEEVVSEKVESIDDSERPFW